ncbi:MAG TPA: acetylxylan esterase [Chloroflexota bacterium]|nr:acetylxylan esterase [Chloroflexota bacterium]
MPASPLPAVAAPLPTLTSGACGLYGGVRICSAQVTSFDGTPLDADLSFPTTAASSHPLVVLLHGFGNDKHEWESTTDEADNGDKWHWNSHWFATHGYYVLAYTARGFDSRAAQGSEPPTPFTSSRSVPNGTIHLKSKEFEVRDTQWLAALAAAALPDLDVNRVAVSGGSYGGGESWLLASQAEWTYPHAVLAALPVLHLQVAIPKYPWTDLSYSLAPNGHGGGPSGTDLYESAQGQPTTGLGNPIGVVKQSYADALFAKGNTSGTFEVGTTVTPSSEGPINIQAWFTRLVTVGDPYEGLNGKDADPIVAQARRGLTLYRSSYYQLADWRRQAHRRQVAVFSISGWTDDLFPPIESFRQFKELTRLDPSWPLVVGVADVGHARAQNRSADWHLLNDRAWEFLTARLGGAAPPARPSVFSLPTSCGSTASTASEVSAATPEGLSAGHLAVEYAIAAPVTLLSPTGVADPNGPATDPVARALPSPPLLGGAGCATSPGPALGGFTAVSAPLTNGVTYVGLGSVRVPYSFVGPTGQLDARIWDVAPNGGATVLVTRGTYRLDVPAFDAPRGTLRVPLFGNHWQLQPGHRLRLDLTEVDQPFLRPSNPPSSITFSNPTLVLPTAESAVTTLAGN